MALVINTTDDFIEAMRQNPEFLAAARRELLTQELIELPEKFAKFRDETLGFRDEVLGRFDSQDGRFDKMDTDIGVIKGISIGLNLEKIGLSRMVSDFGLRRTRIVRLAEHNRASEEFNEAVWDAVDDGIVSEAERKRLTVTDMIVRASMGQTDNIAYVAAEASYTIDEDDIAKVSASVDALQKIFPDARVFACLYGADITDSLRSEAANKDIAVYIEG